MSIKNTRILRGLTQEEVARKLYISLYYYQKIEKGKSIPNVVLGLQLALLLNANPFELFDVKLLESIENKP